jgi:hypothetical protein
MCGRRGQDHIASNGPTVFLKGNDLWVESVACMRLTRVIPLLRDAIGRTQAHARGMIHEIAVEMALVVPDGHDAPLCIVVDACRQHISHLHEGCGTTTLKPAGVVRRAMADRHAGATVVVIEDELLLSEKVFVPPDRRRRSWLMRDAMNP